MKSATSDNTISKTQSPQTNPIDNMLSPLLAPSFRILAHFYFLSSERMYLTNAITESTNTTTISSQTRPIVIIIPPPIIMQFIHFSLKRVWRWIAPDRTIDHSTA